MNRLIVVRELIQFFWQEKKWWLLPLVGILVPIGFLLIFSQTSVIAPLVYPLF